MENTTQKHTQQPNMRGLKVITPEQREAARQRKKEAQEWAMENLKLDWMDESYMKSLASRYGLRTANWWRPCSETKYITRALKACKKDSVWHREVFGWGVRDWYKYNPRVPAWVVQCIILEMASYEEG